LFPFTFKVFTKTDVSAQLTVSGVTTTLAQDSDYTITLNADQDATPGGEVAYTLAVGATLTLLGALPYTQPTDLPSGGAYRAKVVEDALDRLAIQTQQLAEKSDRSLLFSPGFQGDAELPGDAALAGRLLTFDPVTGAPGPSVFTSAQVAAAVGAASPGGASATIVGRETIVATAGQTDFTLSSLSYAPGVGALYVIAGGLFVRKEQVTELSGTTFRLAVAQPAGVEVEAIVARFITSGVEMRQIGALTGVAEHLSGGATDQASYFFKRRATYSGGTPGFVNSGLRVETYVESSTGSGTSSATAFEWSLLGIVYNYAAAGENVGGYFQGNKYNTGGTWGAVAEAIDHRSAVVDPLDDMIGLEVDVRANGTDNNYSRIGIDVVMSRPYTATCCKSFSPKYKTSGRTASSKRPTTVTTPSKWPGRCAASSTAVHAPKSTRGQSKDAP
jgi:hypothetical protein